MDPAISPDRRAAAAERADLSSVLGPSQQANKPAGADEVS